jgi:hypothetical protein
VSDSAAVCGHGRKRNVCPDCAATLQGAKVKYLTDKEIEDAAYEVRLTAWLSVSPCVCLCLSASLCLSVFLCISVSLCVSVCLCHCVSLCFSVSLHFSLCFSQRLTAYSMSTFAPFTLSHTLAHPLTPLSHPLKGLGRSLREPRVSAALCGC